MPAGKFILNPNAFRKAVVEPVSEHDRRWVSGVAMPFEEVGNELRQAGALAAAAGDPTHARANDPGGVRQVRQRGFGRCCADRQGAQQRIAAGRFGERTRTGGCYNRRGNYRVYGCWWPSVGGREWKNICHDNAFRIPGVISTGGTVGFLGKGVHYSARAGRSGTGGFELNGLSAAVVRRRSAARDPREPHF